MSRRTGIGLFALLLVLSAVVSGDLARAQQADIVTFIQPAGDVLPADDASQGHVTVQLNAVAPGPDAGVTLAFLADGQAVEFPGLREVEAGSAVYELRYPINPCALPSHNDLPGAEVLVEVQARAYDRPLRADGTPPPEAAVIGGELLNRVFTLAPDTRAPEVTFEPAAGLQVRPGEMVELFVVASDLNAAGHWASGIHTMMLFDSEGATVGEVTFDTQQTCEEKKQIVRGRQPYTVPADAREGEIIELTAVVTDWANNTTTGVMHLTVSEREEWEGSFSFRIDAPDGSTNVVSFGELTTGRFTFTVDRSINPTGMFGTVRGSGQATRMTYGGRSGDCTVVQYSRPPENVPFLVLGTLANGTLMLVLSDPAPGTATLTVACPGAPPEQASVPWAGGEALHPFGVVLPAMDGARFTLNGDHYGLRIEAELTVRRRTPMPGTSFAPAAAVSSLSSELK